MFKTNNWENIPWVEVRKGVRRRAISSEGATFAVNELEPGHAPKPHKHVNEQIVYIAAGTCDYHIGDQVYRLTTGGLLVVPPNIEHFAEVIGDDILINFDIFTPKRTDYAL